MTRRQMLLACRHRPTFAGTRRNFLSMRTVGSGQQSKWRGGVDVAGAVRDVAGAMPTTDVWRTNRSLPFPFDMSGGAFAVLAPSCSGCLHPRVGRTGGCIVAVHLALCTIASPSLRLSQKTCDVVVGCRRIRSRSAGISGAWPLACLVLVKEDVAQKRRKPCGRTEP